MRVDYMCDSYYNNNMADEIFKYRLIDITTPPPQDSISFSMLTKWEASTKNRAYRANHSRLKFVLCEQDAQ